jgi:hypothetical protein
MLVMRMMQKQTREPRQAVRLEKKLTPVGVAVC